jgi:hypothetical protein
MDISKDQHSFHPIVRLVEGYFTAHVCDYIPSQSLCILPVNNLSGLLFAFQKNAKNVSLSFTLRLVGFKCQNIARVTVELWIWDNVNKKWIEKRIPSFNRIITNQNELELGFQIERSLLKRSTRGVTGCIFNLSFVAFSNETFVIQIPMTNVTHVTNQAVQSDLFKLFLSEVKQKTRLDG